MTWGSKNLYISCFPSSKHNLQIYLNFSKLVIIYLINQKYKDFNIWTYIIHNCRTVLLISWFQDVSSNKSYMWKYNSTSLCLPKILASYGTSTTVVSKVITTSTNAATWSSMENFILSQRQFCLRFLLLNQVCSSFEESKSFVFDGRLDVLVVAEVL